MATLLPNAVQQFTDGSGVPLAGGTVNFYIPGTTTRKDTWSDSNGTKLNTNPIVLNASGENPSGGIYGVGAYRQQVFDSAGNLIWDADTADTSSGATSYGGVSGGSANAQTLPGSSFSSQDGQQIVFRAGFSNTAALTMTVGTSSAIPVLSDTGNGPVACTGGEVIAGNVYQLTYDSARGAFHVTPTPLIPLPVAVGGTGATTALQARINLGTNGFGASNLGLGASVSSSNLTVSLLGNDGNAPSATNPVRINFRDPTLSTGTPTSITITGAVTASLTNGSLIGTSNNAPFRLWIVAFNNSGSVVLGIVNTLSGTSIMALRDGIYSSTAEGGAGGADSAQVIYTSTTVNSQPMTILGYMEWSSGLATAGAWTAGPTKIQLFEPGIPLPASIVQTVTASTSTTSSTSSTSVWGVTNLTASFTPTSTINLVAAMASGTLGGSNSASANFNARMQRGSTTFGSVGYTGSNTGLVGGGTVSLLGIDAPQSASAQTYAVYTLTSNSSVPAIWSIGPALSYMKLDELMV